MKKASIVTSIVDLGATSTCRKQLTFISGRAGPRWRGGAVRVRRRRQAARVRRRRRGRRGRHAHAQRPRARHAAAPRRLFRRPATAGWPGETLLIINTNYCFKYIIQEFAKSRAYCSKSFNAMSTQ